MKEASLIKLDRLYDEANKSLEKLIENSKPEFVCTFNVLEGLKIDYKDLNYQGIYFIELKVNDRDFSYEEWIVDFKSKWEDVRFLKKFTPNTKKKRIKMHSEVREWMPLYLGKSKNIGDRLNGHINQPLHKSTFALKLAARDNLGNPQYRVSTLKVPVSNYDLIAPQIEKSFRDRYNPLVGKQ